jgi:hypothetical protein
MNRVDSASNVSGLGAIGLRGGARPASATGSEAKPLSQAEPSVLSSLKTKKSDTKVGVLDTIKDAVRGTFMSNLRTNLQMQQLFGGARGDTAVNDFSQVLATELAYKKRMEKAKEEAKAGELEDLALEEAKLDLQKQVAI